MKYREYEQYKKNYANTQRIYDALLTIKEGMIESGETDTLSQVDASLESLGKSLKGREMLMQMKLRELELSHDVYDIVYQMRYINHMKVKKIAKIVYYSDTQVYRMLDEIRKEIEAITESHIGRK